MDNAIITVRWYSKRFPGKALVPLLGKPLLQHVIDNSKWPVTVATSIHSPEIMQYCEERRISWMAGEEDDVLQRLSCAAALLKCEHIIRLWGDNPFADTYYRIAVADLVVFNDMVDKADRDHWNQVDEKEVFAMYAVPVAWTYGKGMSVDTPEDVTEIEAYMRRP